MSYRERFLNSTNNSNNSNDDEFSTYRERFLKTKNPSVPIPAPLATKVEPVKELPRPVMGPEPMPDIFGKNTQTLRNETSTDKYNSFISKAKDVIRPIAHTAIDLGEYAINNPVTQTVEGISAGLEKGLGITYARRLLQPKIEASMEKTRQENEIASKVGEFVGMALPFSKASAIVSKIPLLGKIANPYIKSAVREGAAGLGLGSLIGGVDEATRENPNNDRDILGKALSTGADFGIGGAVLGGTLPLIGKGLSNLYKNTIGFNKGIANVGQSIDSYKAPQIREDAIDRLTRMKTNGVEAPPTINPTIPPKYQQTLPKLNEPLMLGEGKTPPSVPSEFKIEQAGDPTRNIKSLKTQNTPNNSLIPQNKLIDIENVNAQSNLKPLKQEGNINSPLSNEMPLKSTTEANTLQSPKNAIPTDVQNKISELETIYKQNVQSIKNDKVMDPIMKSKKLRAIGENHAAQKRSLIQGDSLIPVEGGLAQGELANKIKYLKSNHAGKSVTTPDGEGIATGKNVFGKVQVKMPDGSIRNYDSRLISSKVDIDGEILAQQSKNTNVPEIVNEPQSFNSESPIQSKIKSQREIPNISEMTKAQYDAHYGLDKAPTIQTVTNLIEDTGARVINRTGSNNPTEILETYKKKYKLPSNTKVVYADNLAENVHGKTTFKIDKDGNVISATIKLKSGNSPEMSAGALRHEIEHVIDVNDGHSPNVKRISADTLENFNARDAYSGSQKGHHKNYDWFEADYLRRAEIKDAIKSGKNVADDIRAEVGDVGALKGVNDIVPPNSSINQSIPDELIGRSKVITNTTRTKIPELQTPEGVAFTKTIDDTYGIKPNKQSIERANQSLADDYEGMYNKIVSEGVDSAEDTMAGLQMFRDLSAGNNFDEAAKVIAGMKREGTNKGQTIQAFASASDDSLEGIALRGQKLVNSFVDDLKKSNPDKYAESMSKINNETKTIKDAIKNNTHLLNLNLELFSQNVDKEIKQVMGKLYNKEYVQSIIDIAKSGKYSDDAISNAVKQRYGVPEFTGNDLKNIKQFHDEARKFDPKSWDYAANMFKADDYIKSKLPSSVADKLSTYQFINLYYNTRTSSKIFFGNIAGAVQNHLKDVIKASVDNAISALRGKPMTAQFPSLKTKAQGYAERFKRVIKDRKAEVNTSPFDASYDFDSKSNLTFSDKTRISRFARSAENWTKFMLSISETPFKQAIYDDSLRMLMKAKNTSTPTAEILDEAMEVAQKTMFANKTKATQGAANARASINDVINTGINKVLPQKYKIQNTKDFGAGNIIQPILKTPINMFNMAVDYSPLGLLKIRDQKSFSDQLSKTIIGSLFGIGAGYYGKKTGLMSGGVPKDADARGFAEESGRQAYSWNVPESVPIVGGKSVDVSYIQPLGMLQSFGAELGSENSNKQPFIAALDSLINQGMLQGFATMLGQKSSLTGSASENMANAVTGGASTMVPFSSAMNQVSKSFDTVKRETKDDNLFTRNVLNKSIARTPLRLTLPEKVSNTGEKIKEDSLLNTWLLPGNIKDKKEDRVTNELMRLYDESNQNSQFPTTASNIITYKTSKKGEPQKKLLTPDELAEFKKTLGEKNMKTIKKEMNTAPYKRANDKGKADIISNKLSKNKQDTENKFLKSQGIREYKR